MGKWSAFLVSLIPAILAGYLCFLLVTIGLSVPDETGMMFWGPLGAGFLGCIMAVLTPFGIAIFHHSKPQEVVSTSDSSSDLDEDGYSDGDLSGDAFSVDDDELGDSEFDSSDDLNSSDFESAAFEDESDSDFQTSEFSSEDFEDDGLSSEFDIFAEDEDEEEDDLLA